MSSCIQLEFPWPHPFSCPFPLKRLKAPSRCLLSLPCPGWAKLKVSVASYPGWHSRPWTPSLSPVCHVLQRGPDTGHDLLGGAQWQTDGEWTNTFRDHRVQMFTNVMNSMINQICYTSTATITLEALIVILIYFPPHWTVWTMTSRAAKSACNHLAFLRSSTR